MELFTPFLQAHAAQLRQPARPVATVPPLPDATDPPGTALPAGELSDLMSKLRLGTSRTPAQD